MKKPSGKIQVMKIQNILPLTLLLCLPALGAQEKFISINSSIFKTLESQMPDMELISSDKNATVLKVEQNQIEAVTNLIHTKLNRCGGFMAHESLLEAQKSAKKNPIAPIDPTIEYVINQQEVVAPLVDSIKEANIRSMILKLTSFGTRHYSTKEGIAASSFILEYWKRLSRNRSDVTLELIKHKYIRQPSVVMTILGSEKPDEIIILGGHLDSISSTYEAPGADDNASGIASITEVIRSLMDSDYKPKRTLKFMGYAAEEVGLFGSQDIARSFWKKKMNVKGVMQLDMTLYKGTESQDIVLINDYTNKAQNLFLGRLIDEYVKVPWGWSTCGYGCSDHASWTANGYPASFPFESRFEDSSPHIHTPADTLEEHGGNADHAVKFSKLAAAFVVEMSN